jgi:hypothetical protein
MEDWWIYEVPNAQAAFEASLAIDQTYTTDDVTGLTVYSREGCDDRDHMYLAVCSKNPPQGHIHGVDEILSRFGRRVELTQDEINEKAGLQFVASGGAEIILAGLLWQYPGEIELHWPAAGSRIYWAG